MRAFGSLLRSQLSTLPHSSDRHGRRCKVCHHPDRDAIEDAFLRWQSPESIARDFGIADHSSVYRHAHATGLFSQRSGHIRHALDSIIERASTAQVTGRDVINAIRAAACLTDDGKWVEPAREYIYTHEPAAEPDSDTSTPPVAAPASTTPPVISLGTVPSCPLPLEILIANPTIRT